MYSKELEELIESVLADGVITDQERAVLRKRAQASGEDPDEVMIVVEGRLAKMKKEAKPTKEKRGNVTICPNCGAEVEAGAAKCKECGYVFTNVCAAASINNLFKQLTAIESKRTEDNKDKIFNQASSLVKAFPIPTAKEDLLEFVSTAVTYMEDAKQGSASLILWLVLSIVLIVIGIPLCLFEGAGLIPIGIGGYIIYNKFYKQSYEKKMGAVWKAKMAQAFSKARISLADDPDFASLEERYSKKYFNHNARNIAIGVVAVIVFVGAIFAFNEYKKSSAAEPQAKAQYEELTKKLDALETPDETNYKEVENKLLKITWNDIPGDHTDYKENYLEKKRALASQIGSVVINPEKESMGTYNYNGAPDAIQFPLGIDN